MVLSHKKLKQKFRRLVTESLTADKSKDQRKDLSSVAEFNHELQSVRELLITNKSRRPNLLKRRKKGKDKTLAENLKNEDVSLAVLEGNTSIEMHMEKEGLDDLKERVKNNKRKSGDGVGQELMDTLQKKKQKLKNKKHNLEKKKMKSRQMKLKKKGKEGTVGKEGAVGKDERKNGDGIQSVSWESKIPEMVVPVQVDEIEIKKVYVGGIPYYSSEDDIKSFFQDCGTITDIDCMTFPETGKFRGIAILSFKTEGAAQRALAMDGTDMGGFYLKIQPYKANRTRRSDFAPEIIDGYNRIYVGNLSWDISEDALKQFFSDCRISSIRFGTDKETSDFKGYAHIDFFDPVSLSVALKLDQRILCGRPVKVRCAVPRKSGQTEPSSKSGDRAHNGHPVRYGSSPTAGVIAGAGSGACFDASLGTQKSKKKRQTCYECGTPGHLSLECPQKRVATGQVSAC